MDRLRPETPNDKSPAQSAIIVYLLQQAVSCFQSGRSADAERHAQEILNTHPAHAEANHLLGLIFGQRGQYELADQRFEIAVRSNPNEPSYLLNHGLILQMGKRLEDALTMFDKAIRLQPAYAAAHLNRGTVLSLMGRMELALASYDEALRINAALLEAYVRRGDVLWAMDYLEDASVSYHAASEINPDYAPAHFNQGNVLRALGRPEAALASYERAIQLDPALRHVYNNCGNVLVDLGRIEEALASYEEAIERDPYDAQAHGNRGNVLRMLGHLEAALLACETAVQLNPNLAELQNCYGNVLYSTLRMEPALQAYARAIKLNPHFTEAYYNQGNVLKLCHAHSALAAFDQAIQLNPKFAEAYVSRGNVLFDLGELEAAEQSYRKALELKPADPSTYSNLIFCLAARARTVPDNLLEDLRCRTKLNAVECAHPPWLLRSATGRRLRVGYVSPDLRQHAVSYFFEPLLAAHNRDQFEIFCYDANSLGADAMTARLRGIAEHWRPAAYLDDAELAELIREDGIDVLVDLAGHTTSTRLMAFTHRPAPVQVGYLGFFASTGLAVMDYWLTDTVLHPLDTVELATESIYRLPRCWVCYAPPAVAPEVSLRADVGDQVVFASFSNLSKLAPEVIETWCRILGELPESHMLLMDKYLGDQPARDLIAARFERHGIAEKRLLMYPSAPLPEYLAYYAKVDIVLDPFPRTGGTTTVEALWMGVPVVVLAGDRYVGRISVSELRAVGLDELITETRDDYICKAVSLARDYALRSALRASLRAKMTLSPLCDGPGLARAVESAYLDMWERRLAKASKEGIDGDSVIGQAAV